MDLHDAGIQGYSQWVCSCCTRLIEVWFTDDDWPDGYREPCPWCGPVWGRLQAERTQVIPAPSGYSRDGVFVPDGRMGARATVPIYGPLHADYDPPAPAAAFRSGDPVIVTLPPDVAGWGRPAGSVFNATIWGGNGDDYDVEDDETGDIEPMPGEYLQLRPTGD